MPLDAHAGTAVRAGRVHLRNEREAADQHPRAVEHFVRNQRSGGRAGFAVVPQPIRQVRKVDVVDGRRKLRRQIEAFDVIDGPPHGDHGRRRDPVGRRQADRAGDAIGLDDPGVLVHRRGHQKEQKRRSGGEPKRPERPGLRRPRDRSPPGLEREEAHRRDRRAECGRRVDEEKRGDETGEGDDDGDRSPSRRAGSGTTRGRGADRQRRREESRQGHELVERPAGDREGRAQIGKSRAVRGDQRGREQREAEDPAKNRTRPGESAELRETDRKKQQPCRQEPDARLAERTVTAARRRFRAEKREHQSGADRGRAAAEGHENERQGQDENESRGASPEPGRRMPRHRRDSSGDERRLSPRLLEQTRRGSAGSDGLPPRSLGAEAERAGEGRPLHGKRAAGAHDSGERRISREAPVQQLHPRGRPSRFERARWPNRRQARRSIAKPGEGVAARIREGDPRPGGSVSHGLARAREEPLALDGDAAARERPPDLGVIGESARAGRQVARHVRERPAQFRRRVARRRGARRNHEPAVEPGERRRGEDQSRGQHPLLQRRLRLR